VESLDERNLIDQALLLCAIKDCPDSTRFLVVTSRYNAFEIIPELDSLIRQKRLKLLLLTPDPRSFKMVKDALRQFIITYCPPPSQHTHPTRRGAKREDIFGVDANIWMNQTAANTGEPVAWLAQAAASGLIPFLPPQGHVELRDEAVKSRARADVVGNGGVCLATDWAPEGTRGARSGVSAVARSWGSAGGAGGSIGASAGVSAGGSSGGSSGVAGACAGASAGARRDGDATYRSQIIEFAQILPGRGAIILTRDRIMSAWITVLDWATDDDEPPLRVSVVFNSSTSVPWLPHFLPVRSDEAAIRDRIQSCVSLNPTLRSSIDGGSVHLIMVGWVGLVTVGVGYEAVSMHLWTLQHNSVKPFVAISRDLTTDLSYTA